MKERIKVSSGIDFDMQKEDELLLLIDKFRQSEVPGGISRAKFAKIALWEACIKRTIKNEKSTFKSRSK